LFDRALDEIANEPALAQLDAIRAAMGTAHIENPSAWLTRLNEVIAPADCMDYGNNSRSWSTNRALKIFPP